MTEMTRYAVYFAPRPGDFADRAAAWLGWSAEVGRAVSQPDLPGLPRPATSLTTDPRRYGFHGTLRAPFRPAKGITQADVAQQVARIASGQAPVVCEGLALGNLEGFLALIPTGDVASLLTLAARVVEETNNLRAPLTEAEIARRRPETLSPRQRALLDVWGYPYVMDEFQFHLTLTDRLPPGQADAVAQVLGAHFAPVLPKPFVIEDLCLFGEDDGGCFHLLHRYALTG